MPILRTPETPIGTPPPIVDGIISTGGEIESSVLIALRFQRLLGSTFERAAELVEFSEAHPQD